MPDAACDVPAVTPSLTEFAVYYKNRKAYYACQYAVTLQSRIDEMAGVHLGESDMSLEG